MGALLITVLELADRRAQPKPVGDAPRAPQPMPIEARVFAGLAGLMLLVAGGLTLAVPIPGRNAIKAPTGLLPIAIQPTADAVSGLTGVALGREVFERTGCAACHSVNAGERKIGPSMHAIWVTAATRKPGADAEAYVRESILDPNAFVVDSYPASVMPATFKSQLKPGELEALLAYLKADFSSP
jgi:mono/diheme cytochrome c family protein